MSLNALGIMFKPMLAKYIEPLEQNGTIEKLQADIELIAKSNALPELAKLVSELEQHNRLMERLFSIIEANNGTDFEPGPYTGTAGLIGSDRDGMLGNTVSD